MNKNPPTVSQPNPHEASCHDLEAQLAALNVFTDDGASHLLAYAQFLRAARIANPTLEHQPDAPPEKLVIHFVMADVTLLGSDLKTIEHALQRHDLKFVRSLGKRPAAPLKPLIAVITIAFKEEAA